MPLNDWNLEASEEQGMIRVLEEEARHAKNERLKEAQFEEDWHERRYQYALEGRYEL